MQIKDMTAVVTGASSGVGRRLAERLAQKGARIGLMGRNAERLEGTAARCRTLKATVALAAGNIGDNSYVTQAIAQFEHQIGAPDILVNCAGISLPRRMMLEEIDPDTWHTMIATNLNGTYHTCHAVIAGMKARGKGAIVNIGSTAAHVAKPGVSAYAASKFGVRALTAALIEECDGTGVRVCMVSSGPINTPIWDKAERAPVIEREHMVQPDDVADAVIWLVERPANVRSDEILLRPAAPSPAIIG